MNLSIGQMAKMNSISVQTLHLYDRMGLLKPSKVDEQTGYRSYSITQCAKLDLIRDMKTLGMSLKEIGSYFQNKDTDFLVQKLSLYEQKLDEEMKELLERKAVICQTLESLDQYDNAPKDKSITLEYIPKRTILVYDSGINYFDNGIDVYEQILLHLKEKLSALKMDKLYYHNPGTILRKKYLEKGVFLATEVFVSVNSYAPRPSNTSTLPAGMYQCIYCDSFVKEREYAEILIETVHKNGYIINGDYICETIAELPVVKDDERGMYLRLQIPVVITK